MSKTLEEVGQLREGSYIIVEEEPCKVLSISISKPGKHGEAKARIDAMGIFDNKKRSVVHPVKHKIGIPLIDKRNAQILAVSGDIVQLMDVVTYATFELSIPEEYKDKIKPGGDIQYIEALGKKKITRA
jgi:translation initiation factor 5A